MSQNPLDCCMCRHHYAKEMRVSLPTPDRGLYLISEVNYMHLIKTIKY
jgi:hypothetical protein